MVSQNFRAMISCHMPMVQDLLHTKVPTVLRATGVKCQIKNAKI